MAFEDTYGILELAAARHPKEKRKKRVTWSVRELLRQNSCKKVMGWMTPQALQAELRRWVKINITHSSKKASVSSHLDSFAMRPCTTIEVEKEG